MAAQTRARVCLTGTQEGMRELCRSLLENAGWYEPPEEDCPDYTTEQLTELVHRHARMKGGDAGGFCYQMLPGAVWGDAIPGSCRFTVARHPSGLWTALFDYGSRSAFQAEDWLALHRQHPQLPMLAMYADWDFGLEKGMKIFTGGCMGEDWDRMAAIWLWLTAEYEVGYPPEEAVERLRKLSLTLQREDFDMSIGEMLETCLANLADLAAQRGDAAELAARLQQCRDRGDYDALTDLHLLVADCCLWEMEHVNRWSACLQAVLEAWRASGGT